MRNPHKTWLFWQLSHFPIFGPGATACGPLASCPLSRLAATASRLLALSVTAAAVPAPPRGEPSMCAAKSLCKAKPRLPPWARVPPCGGRRGQPASASTQPMRGGRWQLALSVTAAAVPAPPRGGAKYVRCQKLVQSQVSPPPLGEVSCLRHDREGKHWLAAQLSGSHLLGALPAGKNASLFP